MAGTKQVSTESVRAAQDLVVVFSRLRRQLREVAGFQGLTPSQTSAWLGLPNHLQTLGLANSNVYAPNRFPTLIGY